MPLRIRVPARLRFAASLVLALGAFFTPVMAHAQGAGAYWVALDASPPGTRATITYEAALSSPSESVVQITIPGFWVTTKAGPGTSVYQDLSVPGLGNVTVLGAPHLPIVRFDLGVVTSASYAYVSSVQSPTLIHLGFNVWPRPRPAEF